MRLSKLIRLHNLFHIVAGIYREAWQGCLNTRTWLDFDDSVIIEGAAGGRLSAVPAMRRRRRE